MQDLNDPRWERFDELKEDFEDLPLQDHADRLAELEITEDPQVIDYLRRHLQDPAVLARLNKRDLSGETTLLNTMPQASSSAGAVFPGQVINDRYRILRSLGEGGFGHTFLAEDIQQPPRPCAVKQLIADPDSMQDRLRQERFEREAAILGELGEESGGMIPKLYDYFSHQGEFFLVQELIEGHTLEQKVKTVGPLNVTAVVEILVNLLSTLTYVHEKGKIHRDIKPKNVILREESGKPVLLDFGAAKEVINLDSHGNPTTSAIIGTTGYMPPEQLRGKPVCASDLYALGWTGIYLLTAKHPTEFVGSSWPKHAVGVHPQLINMLGKATELDVGRRCKSAQEMLTFLYKVGYPAPVISVPDTTIFLDEQKPQKPVVSHLSNPQDPVFVTLEISDKQNSESISMKLVPIPAGQFMMGSPDYEEGHLDREFLHAVEISRPFYVGQYPVTVGEFGAFVRSTHYQTDAEKVFEQKSWKSPGFSQTDDHPVVYVSWNDAIAFCEWLSEKEGMKFRLPTEAEWEYSCRAGSKWRFCSGDDEDSLEKVAHYANSACKRQYRATAKVGLFEPNDWGLYDMHGNVWEWCSDWYGESYYKKSPTKDPPGPEAGATRVIRGGSWSTDPLGGIVCWRSANRDSREPKRRTVTTGFRVVLEQGFAEKLSTNSIGIEMPPITAPETTRRPNQADAVESELHKIPAEAADNIAITPQPADRRPSVRPNVPAASIFTNSLGMEFAFVPRGTFWMSANDYKAKRPKNAQQQVEIPYDFYLGVYPVTQGQYRAIMGPRHPSCFSRQGRLSHIVENIEDDELASFPMESVNWLAAQKFVQELIKRTHALPEEVGWMYRLPMDHEWEYACRGAAASREACSFDYYFDEPTNVLSRDQANFNGYVGHPTRVGSYRSNHLGICDMHGNVREWCEDLVPQHIAEKARYPVHVTRGGSWYTDANDACAGSRSQLSESTSQNYVGFRLVRVQSGG